MKNLVEEIGNKLFKKMTLEMSLAIAAGCKLEHEYNSKTQQYTIKTKYPCSVTVDKKGLITIWEKVNGKKERRALMGIDYG